MDMSLTIEGFSDLLASERDEGPLLVALRELMAIKEPEEITAIADDPEQAWGNWVAV